MADVDSRIKQVRQEWQDAIATVQARKSSWHCDFCGREFTDSDARGLTDHIVQAHADQLSDDVLDAYYDDEVAPGMFESYVTENRRSGSVGLGEALDFGDISRTRLAGYMLGTFLMLILITTIGLASLWMAPVTGIVGVALLMRSGEDAPLSMLLGILFLLHPSVLLLITIGFDFTVLAALTGIAGFALAGVEESTKNALGRSGDILFQSISAIMVPLWILSLSNAVLSIFAGQFFNLGFGAMVVASIGTSAYLFAGNIQDAFGVYSGIGHGAATVYEYLVVGHEVRGGRTQLYTATFGSIGLFYYAFLLFSGVNIPVIGFIFENPALPFIAGMLGPLAFWHLLTRAGDIGRAGAAFAEEVYSEGRAGYGQGRQPRGPDEERSLPQRMGRASKAGSQMEIRSWQKRIDNLDSDIQRAERLQDEADRERLSVRSQWSKIQGARDTLSKARDGNASESELGTAEDTIRNAIDELEEALERHAEEGAG